MLLFLVTQAKENRMNIHPVSYGWDREIRTPEMTGSEPVALPLGYIPTAISIIRI